MTIIFLILIQDSLSLLSLFSSLSLFSLSPLSLSLFLLRKYFVLIKIISNFKSLQMMIIFLILKQRFSLSLFSFSPPLFSSFSFFFSFFSRRLYPLSLSLLFSFLSSSLLLLLFLFLFLLSSLFSLTLSFLLFLFLFLSSFFSFFSFSLLSLLPNAK